MANRLGISIDGVKYHVSNILAKLGMVSRVGLRRWDGVPRHDGLAKGGVHMDKQKTVIGVGQIARSVKDIRGSVGWYRDSLGLSLLFSFENLAFFDVGGVRLMLEQSDAPQATESIVYLRVADIHVSYTHFLERGIEFIGAPHMVHRHSDGTEEWMAFFNDPDGRPLAIMCSYPVHE